MPLVLRTKTSQFFFFWKSDHYISQCLHFQMLTIICYSFSATITPYAIRKNCFNFLLKSPGMEPDGCRWRLHHTKHIKPNVVYNYQNIVEYTEARYLIRTLFSNSHNIPSNDNKSNMAWKNWFARRPNFLIAKTEEYITRIGNYRIRNLR